MRHEYTFESFNFLRWRKFFFTVFTLLLLNTLINFKVLRSAVAPVVLMAKPAGYRDSVADACAIISQDRSSNYVSGHCVVVEPFKGPSKEHCINEVAWKIINVVILGRDMLITKRVLRPGRSVQNMSIISSEVAVNNACQSNNLWLIEFLFYKLVSLSICLLFYSFSVFC